MNDNNVTSRQGSSNPKSQDEFNSVTETLLQRLTMCVTKDFREGIQGDLAKLKRSVNEFYFFRTKVSKLGDNGLRLLLKVLQLFTGEVKPGEVQNLDGVSDTPFLYLSIQQSTRKLLSLLETVETPHKSLDTSVECASFLVLLVTVCVADSAHSYIKTAHDFISRLWVILKKFNRRSSDFIAAKVCFYLVLFHSKLDLPTQNLRTSMLEDYRTCVLNHNEPCQAVLTNLILQKYLEDNNLITQAEKFATKATVPENADPFQVARYSYYVGRINVVQLQYSDALQNFHQALRKAPQIGAVGFKQIVTKFYIVTRLLMGEIPERSLFRQKGLVSSLKPYLQLTQAVRIGDLQLFQSTMDQFSDKFNKDCVYMLITRLSHNVIKAALKKISISYSRIHLSLVATKLGLNSCVEAEYIVAKAIQDGVIDAVIEHKNKVMRSTEVSSIYKTGEPQMQLDKRIQYCLTLHQNCQKALRYPEEKPPVKQEIEKKDEKTIEELVDSFLDKRESGNE